MKKYEAPTAQIISFDNDYVVTKKPGGGGRPPRGSDGQFGFPTSLDE